MNVIVFKQDNGCLAIVYPAPEALQHYTIEEIAHKDVPAGKPYAILSNVEIPVDGTFRNAWTIDDSLLTDGIGGN